VIPVVEEVSALPDLWDSWNNPAQSSIKSGTAKDANDIPGHVRAKNK
jgi:hypothetical protein